MDAAREHLWGQLLLERNLMGREDLARFTGERDALVGRGQDCTLGQLLVQQRRLDPNAFAALTREVEGRGRACYGCRRVFLAARPDEPPSCPQCGGNAALRPSGGAGLSGRFPAPTLPALAQQPMSGFFPGGGAASAASSGRFPGTAPQGSGYFPGGGQPMPGTAPQGAGYFPGGGQPMPGTAQHVTGYFPGGGPPTPHGVPAWGGAPPGGAHSGKFQAPQTGSYQAPPHTGSYNRAMVQQPPPSGAHAPANGGPGDGSSGYDPMAAGSPYGTQPSGPPPSTASDAGEVSSGDLGIGKRFGKYEIVQELGRGGMGVVYKVRCPGQPGFLAVKVLLAGEFASPKLMERFREEARLAKRLRHPNIVAVHDVGEVDGIPYYAMDYIEGSELQDMIRQKNLPVRRGVEILVEVARAAHHAHEHGVVHRDLKPSNVLISSAGTSYIMDFGLAKNLEDDKGLTRSGVAIGTPYYMPPEQARGSHREMDARSDVYALGAILYEILTRRVPFTAKTQNELLRKIVEEEPQAPKLVKPGIPTELDTICLKCLQKNKVDRYDSALALAEDLERWLGGKAIEARPEPLWSVLLRRAKKNRTATYAIVGVTAFALLSGGVIVHLVSKAEADRVARAEEEKKRKAADERKAAEDARIAKERETLARKQQAAGEAARRGLAKALEARQVTSVADALRSYEDAEKLLSEAVDLEKELSDNKRERPATVYQRALVRRALCRWDEAREDFTYASRDPAHQARAHLARALIKLRWECDRAGAQTTLGEAVVAQGIEPGAEGREEELTAQGIARAYATYLQGNEDGARKQLVEHASARNLMAAEANAAIAFIARCEGAMLGGDQHLERGLRTADQAVLADQWRFDHRVDRAILRARDNNVEGALDDLRVARALCSEGEMPDLAEAVVALRRRDASRVEDAVRAAEQKASRRSQKASQEVVTFVRRLRATRPPEGGNTTGPGNGGGGRQNQAPPPRNDLPPQKVVITQAGDHPCNFGPGQAGQVREYEIVVGEDIEAIRISMRGAPADLDLFVHPGTMVPTVSDAAFTSTEDGGDEDLVIGRKGEPALITGKYHALVRAMVGLQRPVSSTFSVKYYKKGERAPFPWRGVRELANVNLPDRLRARGEDAMRARASGDIAGGCRILQELEKDLPELGVIRGGWLMEADKYDDAIAVLSGLPPAVRDSPSGLFMRANVHVQAEKFEEALQTLQALIKKKPHYLEVHLIITGLLLKKGDTKAALELGKTVQGMDPFEPTALVIIGGAEAAQGKPEGMEKLRRLAFDPETSTGLRNNVVEVLMRGDQPAKAIELVDELGARGERSLPLDLLKAKCLGKVGKAHEGVTLLRGIRSRVPQNPPILELIDGVIEELEQLAQGGGR